MNPAAALPPAQRAASSAAVPPPTGRSPSLPEGDDAGSALFSRLLGQALHAGQAGLAGQAGQAGIGAGNAPGAPGGLGAAHNETDAPAPPAATAPRPSSDAERSPPAHDDDTPPARRAEPNRDRASGDHASRRAGRADSTARTSAAGAAAGRADRSQSPDPARAADGAGELGEGADIQDSKPRAARHIVEAADEAAIAEPRIAAADPLHATPANVPGTAGAAAAGRKADLRATLADDTELRSVGSRGARLPLGAGDRAAALVDPARRGAGIGVEAIDRETGRAPVRALGDVADATTVAASSLIPARTGLHPAGADPSSGQIRWSAGADALPGPNAVAGLMPAATLGAITAAQGVHAVAGPEGTLAAAPGGEAFARELGTQVTMWVRDGVQQARLQLNPQELGPVQVRIQFDAQATPASQAMVQVQLAADLPATRQALEQALPTLASQLSDAGFTLAGGGVFERQGDRATGEGAPGDGARADGHPADADTAGADASLAQRLDGAAAAGANRVRGLVDLFA